jgi:hypothetical protein
VAGAATGAAQAARKVALRQSAKTRFKDFMILENLKRRKFDLAGMSAEPQTLLVPTCQV